MINFVEKKNSGLAQTVSPMIKAFPVSKCDYRSIVNTDVVKSYKRNGTIIKFDLEIDYANKLTAMEQFAAMGGGFKFGNDLDTDCAIENEFQSIVDKINTFGNLLAKYGADDFSHATRYFLNLNKKNRKIASIKQSDVVKSYNRRGTKIEVALEIDCTPNLTHDEYLTAMDIGFKYENDPDPEILFMKYIEKIDRFLFCLMKYSANGVSHSEQYLNSLQEIFAKATT